MVQSIQNIELFDKKWFTIFDKALMPFGKHFCDGYNCLMLHIYVRSYHIADADIGSLKSLRALFDKYLDHMLVKSEQNPYGPKYTKY